MKRNQIVKFVALMVFCSIGISLGEDSEQLLTIDHFVRVKSTVPSIAGQPTQIYVREKAKAGTVLRSSTFTDRVVLFVHGAGTPAEVAFDVPARDYSWMGYLARAGFDVFSMDATGYGRSTRPPAMNDPCNLTREQQAAFIPSLVPAPCAPSYPRQMTTIASDWDDIGAAVDYVRALRHVDRVSLISWSLGGPRAGGYAAQHPDKVQKLVLLAPAYNRMTAATPPATLPAEGATMNTQSRDEFIANWDRQVGCPAQYEPEALESVWSQMLESDPVGATWGSGVRRAPQVTNWGWTTAMVGKTQIRNRKSPIGQATFPELNEAQSNLVFRISDLRCRIRSISKFPPAYDLHRTDWRPGFSRRRRDDLHPRWSRSFQAVRAETADLEMA